MTSLYDEVLSSISGNNLNKTNQYGLINISDTICFADNFVKKEDGLVYLNVKNILFCVDFMLE